jgi:hypothetical protein
MLSYLFIEVQYILSLFSYVVRTLQLLQLLQMLQLVHATP